MSNYHPSQRKYIILQLNAEFLNGLHGRTYRHIIRTLWILIPLALFDGEFANVIHSTETSYYTFCDIVHIGETYITTDT